ncbi:MAG: GxxExxY protein [Planctomycetes bacterium]|jgi:GxxExxY protein|nr:GxxExxY protein [Planctomycetota bacterium]
MLHKDLTQRVINAAKAVHVELGSGLPRSFYIEALEIELREAGLMAEVDKPASVSYRGQRIGELGADICVNNACLVLCVEGDDVRPEEYGRLRALLKGLELEVGLLLRFSSAKLDIRRVEALPKNKETAASE